MPRKKIRIAVFGKGGAGKSTFSSHLSAHWARKGARVLQVGCDPKADSTMLLCSSARARTVMAHVQSGNKEFSAADVIAAGKFGVHCVESGGPIPGVGCAGYGISLMTELFEQVSLMRRYDAVIFDVLGDIVCGGFSAPLKQGLAQVVVIVISDEFMSYFAANNIAKMVCAFRKLTGVKLAGLVLNSRNGLPPNVRRAQRFAKLLRTKILGVLPLENSLILRNKLTVYETDPDCLFAVSIAKISRKLERIGKTSVPAPLSEAALDNFFKVTYK